MYLIAEGASAVSKTTTTSSSTGHGIEKETSSVQNGLHDQPQPSPPTAAEAGEDTHNIYKCT